MLYPIQFHPNYDVRHHKAYGAATGLQSSNDEETNEKRHTTVKPVRKRQYPTEYSIDCPTDEQDCLVGENLRIDQLRDEWRHDDQGATTACHEDSIFC